MMPVPPKSYLFPLTERVGDLSTAVELKFLAPLIPLRVKAPGLVDAQTRSPALGVFFDEQQLQRQTYATIADTIRTVAWQRSISSFDIQQKKLHEKDFWKSHWVVKKANSAEPARDDARYCGYIWVPVEVSSPKLSWRDPKVLPRVEAVLSALRSRHRIVSNYSCEVHVHIGRNDDTLFSLRTMKRFATLAWLAEPILRAVKDPKSPNFQHFYTWSSALRERSRLALTIKRYENIQCLCSGSVEEFNLFLAQVGRCAEASPQAEALRAIWCAASHVELGKMLSGPEKQYRRLGFNFSALGEEDERANTGPKTIEVRFLEGIVRESAVLGWLRICCRLMEISGCEESTETAFRHAVRRLLKDGGAAPIDQTFAQLMEDIGIDSPVYTPFQNLIRRNYGLSERSNENSLWE
ncbi:hypothetical protein NKR23_g7159 [Pleurostoma richardsiae]|uniref:Amidoligase enzyme n=1 Tax=Pleurostoma richardsiae TaxID=41990 RepID=A0AA38RWP4_9PEZI|nr:hypothetical protein NKR23_g7159 [Pleurostoma richardsiae]